MKPIINLDEVEFDDVEENRFGGSPAVHMRSS